MNAFRRTLLAGIAAVAFALLSTGSAAAAADGWVGERVFLKDTAKPKLGDRTFAWNDVKLPATVTKVNGDWLWVGNAWATYMPSPLTGARPRPPCCGPRAAF